MDEKAKNAILEGRAILGIEFGSTRIKGVLIDETHRPIAMGMHDWENRLIDGVWTYTLDDIWSGLQDTYRSLSEDVHRQYGIRIERLGGLGFSAMMHGYLAFDKDGELLVPFRTWRNTMTKEAVKKLSPLFGFNIPQRWSIAHLYQAMLNKEEHVGRIDYLTTLDGFIHWKLSGNRTLGIGEASGMFPIDTKRLDYDSEMVRIFDDLILEEGYEFKLKSILPKALPAGERAGVLTDEGALLLDPSGTLKPGCPMAPSEGDAGTGMVATNSVKVRTGNVSAGTSIFSMVVLEKPLANYHEELDIVTTPDGHDVAMVHCNNCTSDLNAWISLFKQYSKLMGYKVDQDELYGQLYREALNGDKDCGGVLSYNFYSGEPVAGVKEGRPMMIRKLDSNFTLSNFMRTNLYSALACLKIGNDILAKQETVSIDRLMGHGGLFKTPFVGQSLLAAALNAPVSVMDTASEGGPWGMAVLTAYMLEKKENESLPDYLDHTIFAGCSAVTVSPDPDDVKGFDAYIKRYKEALSMQEEAAKVF